MKKMILFLVFISTLTACEKTGELEFSDVIPGGCNLENKGASANSEQEVDKVTYSFSDGNLNMFVGFNATCCGKYSASSEIKDDLILINIRSVEIGSCNCICYYTFNFLFKGTGKNYKYSVCLDNGLTFTGKIEN